MTVTNLGLRISYFKKPIIIGFITFIIFLLIGNFMLYQRYRILKEAQRREMSTIINLVEKNMNQALKYSYSAALSLGMQVNNEGEVKNFEEVASRLVDNNPNINAVEIVEGGVITHVYPLEENKAALGLQIFEKKIHRIEAFKSRRG